MVAFPPHIILLVWDRIQFLWNDEHAIALSLSLGEESFCPGYLCYKKLNNAYNKWNLGTLKDGLREKHFLSNFQPGAPVSVQTNESTFRPPYQVPADRKEASAFKSKLSSSLTWLLHHRSGHTIPLLKILQWLAVSFRWKKLEPLQWSTSSRHMVCPAPPLWPYPYWLLLRSLHTSNASLHFSSHTPGMLTP